ncbi:MAG: hypothetical protein WED33_09685 [Bacteroidia bacterium]
MKTAGGILFLSLIYLLPSIGLTISKHYCGGEISSISALPFHAHACGCDEEEMDSNCCQDEFTVIKLNDSQNKTEESAFNLNAFSLSIAYFPENNIIFNKRANVPIFIWGDPPDWGLHKSLYKKNQTYLI